MGEVSPVAGVPDSLAEDFRTLGTLEERTPEDVGAKENLYDSLRGRAINWWSLKVACDLWTAAFFMPFQQEDALHMEGVPTTGTLRKHMETNSAHPVLVGRAVEVSQKHPSFQWPLEFPDVWQRGGFDVVLGNPPFLGGKKVSTNFGDLYRNYLFAAFAPAENTTDLCAYFYRRAFQLLRPQGHLGMVATNTIGQGDTRDGGLAPIVREGGSITFGHRFIKWPGAANVEVNLVGIRRGPWNRKCFLDGATTDYISSRLDSEPEGTPRALRENENKAFVGDFVRGSGFVLSPEEAETLLADPRNRDCVYPYLVGDDVNSQIDQSPSRFVICFHDWSLERVGRYPAPFSIVEERVKPERLQVNQRGHRVNWWLYGGYKRELRDAMLTLDRVLVRSRVSELHMLVLT